MLKSRRATWEPMPPWFTFHFLVRCSFKMGYAAHWTLFLLLITTVVVCGQKVNRSISHTFGYRFAGVIGLSWVARCRLLPSLHDGGRLLMRVSLGCLSRLQWADTSRCDFPLLLDWGTAQCQFPCQRSPYLVYWAHKIWFNLNSPHRKSPLSHFLSVLQYSRINGVHIPGLRESTSPL